MRTLDVGQFDAVITIANAIGHLTKAGFDTALQNIRRNLKDGGLYIFDIFNLEAMTDEVVESLAMDLRKTVGETQIHNVQHSTIDRKTGHLTSYDRYTLQEGSGSPKTVKGRFTLQIYTAEELNDRLARHGFETIMQSDMDGSSFSAATTLNLLMVAQKRG